MNPATALARRKYFGVAVPEPCELSELLSEHIGPPFSDRTFCAVYNGLMTPTDLGALRAAYIARSWYGKQISSPADVLTRRLYGQQAAHRRMLRAQEMEVLCRQRAWLRTMGLINP